MDRPLHILIIDDRPESVFLLSEFLLKRHHRVEVSNDTAESLAAIARRRARADIYDLVLCNVRMPGLDGIGLLRDLRQRNDPTPVALIDALADVDAVSYREAEALGCMTFLDKPIDLSRVDQLIAVVRTASGLAPSNDPRLLHGSDQFSVPRTTSAYRSPSSGTIPSLPSESVPAPLTHSRAKPKDEPFFGTARGVRQIGSGTDRLAPGTGSSGRHGSARPGTGRHGDDPHDPFADSYPLGQQQQPTTDPFAPRTDTARIRRAVSGRIERQPATGPVTGSGALERRVVCAICKTEFLVANREHEFTIVCVHCGQLNRIQPRVAR